MLAILYSSEQENTHLIGLHFWHLRLFEVLTDFNHWIHFLAVFFGCEYLDLLGASRAANRIEGAKGKYEKWDP